MRDMIQLNLKDMDKTHSADHERCGGKSWPGHTTYARSEYGAVCMTIVCLVAPWTAIVKTHMHLRVTAGI